MLFFMFFLCNQFPLSLFLDTFLDVDLLFKSTRKLFAFLYFLDFTSSG